MENTNAIVSLIGVLLIAIGAMVFLHFNIKNERKQKTA